MASDPHPIPLTESEVLIRGFLAANPDLDASLGPIEMMTDRYMNEEWAAQIQETEKCVMKEVESGERARKFYDGPKMRNGKEALRQLALTVDHTVLKLDATRKNIDDLCSEARTEGFKVCFSYALTVSMQSFNLQSLLGEVRQLTYHNSPSASASTTSNAASPTSKAQAYS